MTIVSVDVEVDLSEFDAEDLIGELESRGFSVQEGGMGTADPDFKPIEINLRRIEHLLICGLTSYARTEALAMVGAAIHRPALSAGVVA
jgi:hypothetical protein